MNRVYCAAIYCPADPDGHIFVLYADGGNLDIVVLGFRRKVNDKCAPLGYYTASSGNFVATFRDNLSVPSSGLKNPTAVCKELRSFGLLRTE